ncbi:hypothetical protein FB45DRAFT_874210 [Roridomyces roridus]|uniref:Uncharacterized protein n=1 Tax=Roridomyces roridus TaxID=1738132 RepID=A0AAD7B8K9_9AGAR|nr:hypothetical protein FB45DRAFT_874210 [Roridomyces roridus]
MSALRILPSPPFELSEPSSSEPTASQSLPSEPSAPPSTPLSASHIIASATGDELLREGNLAYTRLLREQSESARSYFRLLHYCRNVIKLHCDITDEADSLLRTCRQLAAFDPDEPVAREEELKLFAPA